MDRRVPDQHQLPCLCSVSSKSRSVRRQSIGLGRTGTRATKAPKWAQGGNDDPVGSARKLPLKGDSDKGPSLLPSCLQNPSLFLNPPLLSSSSPQA